MIAIACSVGVIASIQARPADNARLIVNRSADFGINESINLTIDGVRVADLGINQKYDAALSPGKHVLSITTNPKIYGSGSCDSGPSERGTRQDVHFYSRVG